MKMTPPIQLKALSLWQPWASMMALGHKKIETRSWPTAYRGPLVIHATKRWTRNEREAASDLAAQYGIESPFPLGVVLCVVDLFECTQNVRYASFAELTLGDFRKGRWFWVTKNVRPFDEPLPMRGRQGLFNVTDDAVLAAALGAQPEQEKKP